MGQVRRGPGARLNPHLLPLEVVILGLAVLAGHCGIARLFKGAASCEGRAESAQAEAGLLSRRGPFLLPRPSLTARSPLLKPSITAHSISQNPPSTLVLPLLANPQYKSPLPSTSQDLPLFKAPSP